MGAFLPADGFSSAPEFFLFLVGPEISIASWVGVGWLDLREETKVGCVGFRASDVDKEILAGRRPVGLTDLCLWGRGILDGFLVGSRLVGVAASEVELEFSVTASGAGFKFSGTDFSGTLLADFSGTILTDFGLLEGAGVDEGLDVLAVEAGSKFS